MPVRKPDDLPRRYLNAYWSNWWRMLTGRQVDSALRGRCSGCGVSGVLGYDLIHRGPTMRVTLLCDKCCED
jgi:hypothetical protein